LFNNADSTYDTYLQISSKLYLSDFYEYKIIVNKKTVIQEMQHYEQTFLRD